MHFMGPLNCRCSTCVWFFSAEPRTKPCAHYFYYNIPLYARVGNLHPFAHIHKSRAVLICNVVLSLNVECRNMSSIVSAYTPTHAYIHTSTYMPIQNDNKHIKCWILNVFYRFYYFPSCAILIIYNINRSIYMYLEIKSSFLKCQNISTMPCWSIKRNCMHQIINSLK